MGLAKEGLAEGELHCEAEFQYAVRGGIDAIRSKGLLGLLKEVPSTADKKPRDVAVWDWAGVQGEWFGLQAFPRNRGPYFHHYDFALDEQFCPFFGLSGYFNLTVVRIQADIDAAWAAFQPACSAQERDLWTGLITSTEADLGDYANPLPPVFFHGRDRDNTTFIYGWVTLTNDDAPVPVWRLGTRPRRGHKTLVFETPEELSFVISGYQAGGRGCRRGVIGVGIARNPISFKELWC